MPPTTYTAKAQWTPLPIQALIEGNAASIACATSAICFVGGSNGAPLIVRSSSGLGGPWTSIGLPRAAGSTDDPGTITSIACSRPSLCIATDATMNAQGVILRSVDAGVTWQSITLPNAVVFAGAAWCVRDGVCMAVGAEGTEAQIPIVLTSSGDLLQWSIADLNARTGTTLNGIACLGAKECLAVGHLGQGSSSATAVYASTDGGRSWRSVRAGALTRLQGATTITCFTAGRCIVAGYLSFAVTHDGGASWSWVRVPPALQIDTVDCYSASDCVALGGVGEGDSVMLATSDGGTTWKSVAVPSSIKAVFFTVGLCQDSSDCLYGDAVGGVVAPVWQYRAS
jgi:photosystem II stability/assembly factor-like uncharacterized protein